MIHVIRSFDKPETGLNYQKIIDKVSRYISAELIPVQADFSDRSAVYKLLRILSNPKSGLKPRNKKYIREKISRFTVIKQGKEVIACGEMIDLDENTLELGAMGTHPKHQNKGLSGKILERAEWFAEQKGKDVILVTDNESLMRTLWKRGYTDATHLYRTRHTQSPTKKIYVKKWSGATAIGEPNSLSLVHGRTKLLTRELCFPAPGSVWNGVFYPTVSVRK